VNLLPLNEAYGVDAASNIVFPNGIAYVAVTHAAQNVITRVWRVDCQAGAEHLESLDVGDALMRPTLFAANDLIYLIDSMPIGHETIRAPVRQWSGEGGEAFESPIYAETGTGPRRRIWQMTRAPFLFVAGAAATAQMVATKSLCSVQAPGDRDASLDYRTATRKVLPALACHLAFDSVWPAGRERVPTGPGAMSGRDGTANIAGGVRVARTLASIGG
jgi:hypothetical protein